MNFNTSYEHNYNYNFQDTGDSTPFYNFEENKEELSNIDESIFATNPIKLIDYDIPEYDFQSIKFSDNKIGNIDPLDIVTRNDRIYSCKLII